MAAFDVITYGGGESYRDIFVAVALMTGTGAMASLVRVGLLLGLVIGILRMVVDLNPGRIVKWFLVAAMIYGGLFLPKATVHIIDKYNPALPGADVANVPLGVAFAEATASQIGSRMIDMTETAFGDPTDVEYSRTGMIYGVKFMEAASRLQFADQLFTQNLDAFFKNCVWYDLQDNAYTADELAKANDLWAFFAAHPPNPARGTPLISGSGPSAISVVTCPSALSTLDAQKDVQAKNAATAMERRLNPSMNATVLESSALSEMGVLVGLTNVASTDATRSLVQTATLNQLKASLIGSSTETGASSALAQAQAQLQTANTGSLLGRVGENAIVVLKIVIDALFVGMFPILFPCFLLPQIGTRMLQGYLAGFFYLQLWGPMYVIVHKIIMTASYAQTGAAAMLPGNPNGFNLQTLDGINGVNANIQTVAGMMVLMIPVLAAALTKGAMAVGAQGEALLQPFRSGAEAAAAAQTTGNFSVGNTSVDTHAFNNVTGNRIQTSGYVDSGFVTTRSRSGDEVTSRLSDGVLTGVRAAPSDAAVSLERLHERATSLSERARIARERSNTFDHVESAAKSDTSQQIHEAAFTRTTGAESRAGVANEERDGRSTAASYITGIRDEAQRRFGVSFDFAADATEQATEGLQDSWSVSTGVPIPGGSIGHRSNLQGSATKIGQRRNSLKEDEALSWIRQQTQSSDFRTSIDKATTESLNRSFASFSGSSHSVSDKTAQIFASTKSFTDSARAARSETASLERSAEQSERTAQVLRGQHAAAFVSFAGDHLRTTADGFQRSNEDIGRILQGRTEEDRELLYQAADTFSARYLPSNDEPALIENIREASGEPQPAAKLKDGPHPQVDQAPSSALGSGRRAPPSRYGGGAPDPDDVQAHAAALGLRPPSVDRELEPDNELAGTTAKLNRDVDAHLAATPKKIPKEK
jgi:conjugal transfer mating pair stabilization protein TraG